MMSRSCASLASRAALARAWIGPLFERIEAVFVTVEDHQRQRQQGGEADGQGVDQPLADRRHVGEKVDGPVGIRHRHANGQVGGSEAQVLERVRCDGFRRRGNLHYRSPGGQPTHRRNSDRRQFQVGKLPAFPQFLPSLPGERRQRPEAPVRFTAGDDHPVAVGDQHLLRGLLRPVLLQGIEGQLEDDRPADAAADLHRMGKEITGGEGGRPDGEVAPGLAAQGRLEIGAESVIVADVARFAAPVAGGQGETVGIQHVDGGGPGFPADFLQVAIDPVHLPRIPGGVEQVDDVAVFGQGVGEEFVPLDLAGEDLLIKAELAEIFPRQVFGAGVDGPGGDRRQHHPEQAEPEQAGGKFPHTQRSLRLDQGTPRRLPIERGRRR